MDYRLFDKSLYHNGYNIEISWFRLKCTDRDGSVCTYRASLWISATKRVIIIVDNGDCRCDMPVVQNLVLALDCDGWRIEMIGTGENGTKADFVGDMVFVFRMGADGVMVTRDGYSLSSDGHIVAPGGCMLSSGSVFRQSAWVRGADAAPSNDVFIVRHPHGFGYIGDDNPDSNAGEVYGGDGWSVAVLGYSVEYRDRGKAVYWYRERSVEGHVIMATGRSYADAGCESEVTLDPNQREEILDRVLYALVGIGNSVYVLFV